jgi:hypothetical protein
MKTQPNPALKNTAIFVGIDALLTQKAIDYYKENGYPTYSLTIASSFDYIATMSCNTKVTNYPESAIKTANRIITLPTEPKSEYPKRMLVSHDNENWNEKLVITEHQNGFIVNVNAYHYEHYDFAKDIPTVTLTQSELIEAYEKSNNVKVIIK